MTAHRSLEGKAAEPKKIVVTGITGKQGGATARLLLKRGHTVRGISRQPNGPAATEIRRLGAEVVPGDLENRESLRTAVDGFEAIFVVATMAEKGTEGETRQAVNAMEVAHAARVPHVVYSSVSDADTRTGIPHFDSKARAEERLRASGADHTIVAPVFFMENLTSPYMVPGLAKGTLAMGLPGDRPLQGVSVGDIARFTVLALENPKEFRGKRVNIAGDELPPNRIAEVVGAAAGRKIGFQQIPLEMIRKQSPESATMFEWFNRVGYSADVAALRTNYPEVGWQSYQSWAAGQPWSKILDLPSGSSG